MKNKDFRVLLAPIKEWCKKNGHPSEVYPHNTNLFWITYWYEMDAVVRTDGDNFMVSFYHSDRDFIPTCFSIADPECYQKLIAHLEKSTKEQ